MKHFNSIAYLYVTLSVSSCLLFCTEVQQHFCKLTCLVHFSLTASLAMKWQKNIMLISRLWTFLFSRMTADDDVKAHHRKWSEMESPRPRSACCCFFYIFSHAVHFLNDKLDNIFSSDFPQGTPSFRLRSRSTLIKIIVGLAMRNCIKCRFC